MSDEEPTGPLCVICWEVPAERGQACNRDAGRLAAALWEVRDLHPRLRLALLPGQGQRQLVRVGQVEAPLPLRVDVLDLAAPARGNASRDAVQDYVGDQEGDIPVAEVLDSWARDWGSQLGEDLPEPTVDAVASWMLRRLDWALDWHPALRDFASELMKTVYRMRAVLNVSRAPLYSPDACPRCGTAALRRQSGDKTWRCGDCKEEVEVVHPEGCECGCERMSA